MKLTNETKFKQVLVKEFLQADPKEVRDSCMKNRVTHCINCCSIAGQIVASLTLTHTDFFSS